MVKQAGKWNKTRSHLLVAGCQMSWTDRLRVCSVRKQRVIAAREGYKAFVRCAGSRNDNRTLNYGVGIIEGVESLGPMETMIILRLAGSRRIEEEESVDYN